MADREKTIKGLYQHCEGSMFDRCSECPYYEVADEPFRCRDALLMDALALLREQEPHLLTTEDFVRADHYGYLAVWAEERNGDQFWKNITIRALEYDKKRMRYWSSRPTNEQREAVKWG